MTASKMPLCSMTGFARTDGSFLGGDKREASWIWELKSVNGRGLEARFRLPSGFDFLEPALRKMLGTTISRGSVNISLNLRSSGGGVQVRVNQDVLDQVLPMIDAISLRTACDKPRAENILNIRGVLEQSEAETDIEERTALGEALKESFSEAVDLLQQARASEGTAMEAVLSGQLNEVERLTGQARSNAEASPVAIGERLALQIKDMLTDAAVPEDRIAQEAALLAVKADIREELDRLDAHVEAARDLLNAGGATGRKFDFLTQEFNREANTLCSKASTMSLKRTGLDLKSVIDQMREQIQNVE